jgi:hypothetical protein
VTIDCPSDCEYLAASRDYDMTRLEIDGSKMPFPDVRFDRQFADTQGPLLLHLDHAIGAFAAEHRELVDTDALAALQGLAETYRTQSSGIIYEKPPDYPLQRALYGQLQEAIKAFREQVTRAAGMTVVRDSDFRDALMFLSQLCATYQNGRPKGRAYLDIIRKQFPKEEFQKSGSNIVLL